MSSTGALFLSQPELLKLPYLLYTGFGIHLSSIRPVLGSESGVAPQVVLRYCTKTIGRSGRPFAQSVKIQSIFDLVDGKADKTELQNKGKIFPDTMLLFWSPRVAGLLLPQFFRRCSNIKSCSFCPGFGMFLLMTFGTFLSGTVRMKKKLWKPLPLEERW
jgi:hypothetical protein